MCVLHICHVQEAVNFDVARSNQRQTATTAQARSQPPSTSSSTPPDTTTCAAEEMLWLTCLAKMTGHVVTNLPKVWQLAQVGTESCCYDSVSTKTRMPDLPCPQHDQML